MIITCQYHLCSNEFEVQSHGKTTKKYCSTPCRTKRNIATWRKNMKRRAVDYKGGKCQGCGYDKCVEAFDFHHRDPEAKEFGISSMGHCRSWDKMKAELDKCDLLCSNCHRERHAT